jgi:type IV pilus assembly protein PilA
LVDPPFDRKDTVNRFNDGGERVIIQKKRAGFTLVELMIVVSLIGVLSAVAIPGFMRYQMRAKRAEAFTNLVALSKAEHSYFAEFAQYVSALGEPITSTGLAPNPQKRSSSPITDRFVLLGWNPEGDVYYDYDACSVGGPGCTCSCATCFTVSAWGDLDDDGSMSGYMYFQPDVSGDICQSAVDNHFPPVHADGTEVLSTAAWHGATDDF